MDIGISHSLLRCYSAIWGSASSFVPNEMMTFYVTPSYVLVRERRRFPFPFIPHSCRLFHVGFFFLFSSVLCSWNSTCDHSKLLWLMVLSSALPAAVLTGCGVHSDSKQGWGFVISCPRSVLSLCISPERPAKPDSSDSVAILQGNNCITARIKKMLSFRVEKNIFLEAKKRHVHRCGSLPELFSM